MNSNTPTPRTRVQLRRDPYARPDRSLVWLARLALLFVALTAIALALLVILATWQEARRGGVVVVEGGSPNLGLVERLYLQGFLAARADELASPAGSGTAGVSFVVAPGETANQIAANLAAAALLDNPELFLNYLRYYGLDSRLEAGTFQLTPQDSIPELASTLTRAIAQDVVVRFVEGWRVEEMADHLAQSWSPAFAADFLAIARRGQAHDLSQFEFLASLSPGATLEGFLFPDTYRLPADAAAAYLVDQMLANFGRRVTPVMRQAYGAQGFGLREAVTLASIVEREAVVPAERPLIVGVFLNRLAQDIRLEADPTVQYAVGYLADTGQWWKSPLFLADLELDSPYNTYRYTGLPPGPIANPGLASLQAVAQPEPTGFLFFVVDCTAAAPGSHRFSATFEEHLANVERCR